MLEFRIETDLKEFDRFVEAQKGSFLQCSRWPQVKTVWKPYFYSGFRDGERVLTCLVLERRLSLCGRIWYVPDGPVTDYGDRELLLAFTSFLRQELRSHGATALLTDPHVPLRINNETTAEGLALHSTLLEAGFTLNHDAARYIYKSPIQYMIPLRKESGELFTAKELLKKCEKGVRYSVRIGESRGLVSRRVSIEEIEREPQLLEDFATVMRSTSERDSFIEKKPDYIKTMMSVFHDCMDLTLV